MANILIRIASVQKFEDDNFYEILNRARLDLASVEKETREIIDSVKSRGDEALFDLTEKFDSAKLNIGTIKATKKEITEAYEIIKPAEIKAMNKAAANIKRFQQLQLGRIEFEYEKQEVKLGLISRFDLICWCLCTWRKDMLSFFGSNVGYTCQSCWC